MKRARDEWDRRIDIDKLTEPIRKVLGVALERDPKSRCSADSLKQMAEKELASSLRNLSPAGRFSPVEELGQIEKYIQRPGIVELMPRFQIQAIRDRLAEVKAIQSLDSAGRTRITLMENLLGPQVG